MKRGSIFPSIVFWVAVALFSSGLFLPSYAVAAVVGKFTLVEGRVEMLKGGSLPAIPARLDLAVEEKDIIRTKSASRAEITMNDNSVFRLAQRSRIDISEYSADDPAKKGVIKLGRGRIEAIVDKKTVGRITTGARENTFEIHTPNAVAGVRGTHFFVSFVQNLSTALVKDGTVFIYNIASPDNELPIPPGFISSVLGGNNPSRPRPATEAETRMFERIFMGIPGEDNDLGAGDRSALPPAGPIGDAGIANTGAPGPNDVVIIVPIAEVGRVDLSGSIYTGDYVTVFMNDVVFFAPSTGQKPGLWLTNSIDGAYDFSTGDGLDPASITGPENVITLSDGDTIEADFQFTTWDAASGRWTATVNNGAGTLSGGTYTGPVSFKGDASGTVTGTASGTFSGTGSGTVR